MVNGWCFVLGAVLCSGIVHPLCSGLKAGWGWLCSGGLIVGDEVHQSGSDEALREVSLLLFL